VADLADRCLNLRVAVMKFEARISGMMTAITEEGMSCEVSLGFTATDKQSLDVILQLLKMHGLELHVEIQG